MGAEREQWKKCWQNETVDDCVNYCIELCEWQSTSKQKLKNKYTDKCGETRRRVLSRLAFNTTYEQ